MHDACRAISRGDLDVVLVTGAEAMYARALARRDPGRAPLAWASQPAEGTPPPVPVRRGQAGRHRPRDEPRRAAARARLPPVRERAAGRQRVDAREHAARIGALWARFSEVAAGNPHAWIRTPRTAAEIVTPGTGQPDGLVPLPQAVHGQHAGRPGRRLHRLLGRGGPRRRRARGALGLPARRRRRQRPLVHLAPARAAPLARHPARRRGRARAGRARDRRRGVDRPLLVLPRGRADGRGRARAARRRPGPAADADRRAHLRRRAREQLHLARHRPRRRRAARRARDGRARHGAGLVRHQALHRDLRLAPARRTAAPSPSPGATSSPRSTRCPSAGSTPTRPGRCASRPTP